MRMESIDNITEQQSSDLREWLSSLYMEFSPEKYSRHRCLRQCHWLPGFTEVLTKPGVKGEATRPVHCDGNKLSHSVFLSHTHSLPLPISFENAQTVYRLADPPPLFFLFVCFHPRLCSTAYLLAIQIWTMSKQKCQPHDLHNRDI